MVSKSASQLEPKPMSSAAYVDRARGMAKFLEDREAVLVGDREIARTRLEQRYGIASSIFYSLRYRPPKQIAADTFDRLCQAVAVAAQQQIKALENDIASARACDRGLGSDAVCEAEAALAKARALLGRQK